MKSQIKIILASSSPRRRELLKNAGLRFTHFSPDVDEKEIRGEGPRKMVRRLALEKANAGFAVATQRNSNFAVIAADTIVVTPDGQRVLGKPRSKLDAARMLRKLSGKRHWVYTGYAILSDSGTFRKKVRAVKTSVKFMDFSSRQILDYVASGEPMDKAGAYAAQGRGMVLIESIRGSYTNVVGLPMVELLKDLEAHFGLKR